MKPPPRNEEASASTLAPNTSTSNGANRSTVDLAAAAAEIKTTFQAAQRLADDALRAGDEALELARQCGEKLSATQDAIKHGEFGPFVAQCGLSRRQAEKLKRLAREWTAIKAKCAPGAHLTINKALALIAEPRGGAAAAPPKPIDWEVRIGEAADVAPLLDPAGIFFTVTKDDKCVVIQHSEEHAGYYVISRCGVVRDQEGEIVGVEEEEDVFRPLAAYAVGFWLEHFGCTRGDTWLRCPRGEIAKDARA